MNRGLSRSTGTPMKKALANHRRLLCTLLIIGIAATSVSAEVLTSLVSFGQGNGSKPAAGSVLVLSTERKPLGYYVFRRRPRLLYGVQGDANRNFDHYSHFQW